jgi:lipopolysaccharide export system permease protein
MPVLVRYCLMAIWGPFFIATGTTVFVFNLLYSLREFLDYLLVQRAGVMNSFLMLFYLQPGYLILAMPIGFLIAVMIVYGRLSSDREVVAVQAAGFPVSVLAWPMVALAVLFSIFMVFFWDLTLPWGNTSFLKLQYKIINERSSVILRERSFVKDFDGYVLYVGHKDEQTDLLTNVTIQLLDGKGYPYRVIVAKTGKMMQNPKNYHVMMQLNDGVMQQIGTIQKQDKEEFFQMGFHSCDLDLSVNRLRGGPGDFQDSRNISISQLADRIATKKNQKADIHYDELEFYKKLSMPFAALAFVIVGIPLALLSRAGSFTGPFLAIGIVIVYWMFDIFGETGPLGVSEPFWAMWLPDLFFVLVGAGLIYWLNHKTSFKVVSFSAFERTWRALMKKVNP